MVIYVYKQTHDRKEATSVELCQSYQIHKMLVLRDSSIKHLLGVWVFDQHHNFPGILEHHI